MASVAEAREWVLREVVQRTSSEPDGIQQSHGNVWVGRRHVIGDKDKADRPPRSELNAALLQLVEDGELIYWHGLTAPATEEHLRAVIENEVMCDVPRQILIGKANKLLSQGDDS